MRQTSADFGDMATEFLAAPFRAKTYKRLAYLLVAFPLGLAYFVGFTVGGSLGVGLAVTWVGIPILLATLAATTLVSGFEAHLARALLDRDVPVPRAISDASDRAFERPEGGYWAGLKRFLADPTTWSSVGVVLAKFAYGVAAFVVVVTAGALLVAMLAAPFVYDDPNVYVDLAGYTVDTLPAALGVAGLGVVWAVVSANLVNAVAALGGLLTEALLSVGHEDATA
jgi:hypothetical protein